MKLLFISGSRGEWGYIRPLIEHCIAAEIDYSICATNMLLLPQYGLLVEEMKSDGFRVDDEILMSLEGSNHYTMAKSLAVFLASFIDVINRYRPTWIILAGDRGEQLMGAVAGAYTYTPVAHIQAGERSGNIDGISRHAIGKFSHLHFAANDDAVKRLLGLGEQPFRIHNVGAPQLDELTEGRYSSRCELDVKYKIGQEGPYLLIVLHPVTEEMDLAEVQVRAVVESLSRFSMPKIWVLSNNDAGSESLRQSLLENRCSDIQIFENITRKDYLGLLKNCKAIIGNSSSGLLEAPSFKVPCVNIGRRQADRIQGANVVNTCFSVELCVEAIRKAISQDFAETLSDTVNPYGDGRSSKRILDILCSTAIDERLLVKNITF